MKFAGRTSYLKHGAKLRGRMQELLQEIKQCEEALETEQPPEIHAHLRGQISEKNGELSKLSIEFRVHRSLRDIYAVRLK